jgi:hypothetical protein
MSMKVYRGSFVIDAQNQGGFDIQQFADGVLVTLGPGELKTFRRLRFNAASGKTEWSYH